MIARCRKAGLKVLEVGVLRNVSATQVEAFRECPRKWYARWILGIKVPKTLAQDLGGRIHRSVEAFAETGAVDPAFVGFLDAARPFMPERGTALIEHEDRIETYDGGPPWIVKPDMVEDRRATNDVGIYDRTSGEVLPTGRSQAPPRISDWKTIGQRRYMKKPAELRRNTQLVSYARWLQLQDGTIDEVDLRHLYLTKTSPPKCEPVCARVHRDYVDARWAMEIETVREMVRWAAAAPPDMRMLPPNPDSCSAYGGCYFVPRCGLSALGGRSEAKGEASMNLIERLNAKKAAQAGVPGAAVPSVAPVPSSPAAPSAPAPPAPAPGAQRCGAPCGFFPGMTCELPSHAGRHQSTSANGGMVNWDESSMSLGKSPDAAPRAAVAPSAAPTAAPAAAGPSLAERLAAAKARAGAAAPAAAPLAAQPPTAAQVAPPAPVEARGTPGNAAAGEIQRPTVTTYMAYPSIVPPDAAPRTSTPQEIEQAESAQKKRRGRRPAQPAAAEAQPPDPRQVEIPGAQAAPVPQPPSLVPEGLKSGVAVRLCCMPGGGSTCRLLLGHVPPHVAADGTMFHDAVDIPAATTASAPFPAAAAAPSVPAAAPQNGQSQAVVVPVEEVYVDCLPIRGSCAPFTIAEDVLAPLAQEAARISEVQDWRLVSYTSKGVLATIIRQNLSTLPRVLVVSSYSPGADVLLEVVIPYAKKVVRALRG